MKEIKRKIPSPKSVVKILISGWLVYHLLVIVAIPNQEALPLRKIQPYILDYANVLFLNAQWRFFSPGPAPNMFLEYEVEFHDAEAAEEEKEFEDRDLIYKSYRWPNDDRSEFNFPNFRRLLYAMRYFVLERHRIPTLFVPWLCRRYPQAHTVSVQHIYKAVPPIESLGGALSIEQMEQKGRLDSHSVDCVEETLNE